MVKEKIMLSACLAGINCVYDGTNKFHPVLAKMYKDKKALIFCPEVLGGLKVPHSPSEIGTVAAFAGVDGFSVLEGKAKVISVDGRDVTVYFLEGAKRALEFAKRHRVRKAILKSKSPSCGCGRIFDGTFSKKLVPGYGVTAALLKKNGIEVMSDIEYLGKTAHGRRTAVSKQRQGTRRS